MTTEDRLPSAQERHNEESCRSCTEQQGCRPHGAVLRQGGHGTERYGDLEQSDRVGVAVVVVKKLVRLPGLLVALLLLLARHLLDLLLLFSVALLFLGVLGWRLLGDREPRGARGLRGRRLDPLGLVVGPLVRRLC